MKPAAQITIALALIAGVALSSAWLTHSVTDKAWQAKWSARDAADLAASKTFTEQQRRIELQRQGAIDDIQAQADKDIAKAQRNASIAAAESKRLQNGIADAITRIKSGGSDTSTTISSTARDKASLLLAELFGEIDTAAGNYAEEADRAYDAGKRCERSYDAVRGSK